MPSTHVTGKGLDSFIGNFVVLDNKRDAHDNENRVLVCDSCACIHMVCSHIIQNHKFTRTRPFDHIFAVSPSQILETAILEYSS